jgi:hypothetical protein
MNTMPKLKYIFLIIMLLPSISLAQNSPTFSMESSSSTVSSQSDFAVSVFLSTDVAINAFDMKINYSPEQVSFVDADNTGSIVNIWTNSPKEDPAPGTIYFAGGLLKPFTGEHGFISKLHFHVLISTETRLSTQFVISENSLYLANGQGTKISAGTLPISITILPSGISPNSSQATKDNSDLTSFAGDTTPPVLEFRVVKSLADGSLIAIFYASDDESGIKSIEIRNRIGLLWSAWRSVENFSPLGENVWATEVRATNKAGLQTFQREYLWQELLSELRVPIALLFVFLIIVFLLYFHYRKMYNKYKNPYV